MMDEVFINTLPFVRQNGKNSGKLKTLGEKSDGEEKKMEKNSTNI